MNITIGIGIWLILTTTSTVNDKRYEIVLDSCNEFPLVADVSLARPKELTDEVVGIYCSNHYNMHAPFCMWTWTVHTQKAACYKGSLRPVILGYKQVVYTCLDQRAHHTVVESVTPDYRATANPGT